MDAGCPIAYPLNFSLNYMARDETPRRAGVNANYTIDPLPREVVQRVAVLCTSAYATFHTPHLTSIVPRSTTTNEGAAWPTPEACYSYTGR